MSSYSRDPRWITAKYAGKCNKAGCGAEIRKGDRAFSYPATRTLLGSACGHADEAARVFEAARFDEEQAPQAL